MGDGTGEFNFGVRSVDVLTARAGVAREMPAQGGVRYLDSMFGNRHDGISVCIGDMGSANEFYMEKLWVACRIGQQSILVMCSESQLVHL